MAEKKKMIENVSTLFKSPEDQQFFDRHGYLRPEKVFLNKENIDALVRFLDESGIRNAHDPGFTVGLENSDKDLVKNMMDKIVSIVLPEISTLFTENTGKFIASYLGKAPRSKGIVLPHQDWTFVNEEGGGYTFSCWIPLTDVNLENGCMGLIKGSHRIFKSVRASPAAKAYSPLAPHVYTVAPYMQLFPMKAGEVLVFNNKTFHASLPNTSALQRDAVALVFSDKNVQFYHYHLKPGTNDTLLKFKVDPGFFAKYDDKILLQSYELGMAIKDYAVSMEVPIEQEEISTADLLKRIEADGNVYNEELDRMIQKFNGSQSTWFDYFAQSLKKIGGALKGRIKA